MSLLRHTPESGNSGTAYTFLKPMPSVRAPTPESAVPPSVPEIGTVLFPAKDAANRPTVTGVSLGPYVIEEEIGRGGMGAVFRAMDSRLDRVVALKVLGPELSKDRSSVTRFQNEARAAAKLDHECIARVHDVGNDYGLYYIAFEFVPGSNLREVLTQNGGPLSPEQAVGFTLQIADALRHTSAADVVHRDIKPSNIILSPTGRAKLVDWGLARQNSLELSQELTQMGTTLGTFDYISPEQAVDPRNVDVRSDIYSLGCTLFHMLTGEPPYPRGSMFQKVLDHHRTQAPDASKRNPNVPPELAQVVQRMMASELTLRYADADELIHDLTAVASELGLRPVSPVAGIWMASEGRGYERVRAGWGWLGAFTALLLLVWVVDRTSQRGPEQSTDRTPVLHSPRTMTPEAPRSAAPPAPETGIVQGAASRGSREIGTATLAETTDSLPIDPSRSKAAVQKMIEAIENGLSKSVSPPERVSRSPASFVVNSPNDPTPQRFPSLEAACSAARDLDVIELDFDGPTPELVRPLKIVSKRLTIRAASGRRPQLNVGLSLDEAQLAIDPNSRLISVSAGGLTIMDVDLVVTVPPGSRVERWSLFALTQAARVTLRGASITVVNDDRQPVSITEAATSTAGEIGRGMADGTAERSSEVSLESCVVRGRADFLWHSSPEIVAVRATECAFALNGAFYRRGGTARMDVMSIGDQASTIELDRVTAVLDRSLVLLELGDRQTTRPVKVTCRNSVVRIGDQGQTPPPPLVSMSGQGDADDYDRFVAWDGRSNVFDVRGPACEITVSSFESTVPRIISFGDWLTGRVSDREAVTLDVFRHTESWSQSDFADARLDDFSLRDASGAGVDLQTPSLPRRLPVIDRSDRGAFAPSRTELR